MDKSKQNAIDWLKSQLEKHGDSSQLEIGWEELDSLFLKAKSIERENGIKISGFETERFFSLN